MTKTEPAYAKINLYLDILGTRQVHGRLYHDIESVMQTVSLCDMITVSEENGDCGSRIKITSSSPTVPTGDTNIAWRCAEFFFRECLGMTPEKYPSVSIHIEKNIPVSAGVGGGSADGAAVIRALAGIYGTGLDNEGFVDRLSGVGADIPFVLRGGTALCRGIGEEIIPLSLPEAEYSAVIVKPECDISAAAAYEKYDELTAAERGGGVTAVIDSLKQKNIPAGMFNAFEQVAEPEYPDIKDIKRILRRRTDAVLMSGSGPSVFGLFENETDARAAADELRQRYGKVYVCRPVTCLTDL